MIRSAIILLFLLLTNSFAREPIPIRLQFPDPPSATDSAYGNIVENLIKKNQKLVLTDKTEITRLELKFSATSLENITMFSFDLILYPANSQQGIYVRSQSAMQKEVTVSNAITIPDSVLLVLFNRIVLGSHLLDKVAYVLQGGPTDLDTIKSKIDEANKIWGLPPQTRKAEQGAAANP